MPIEVTPDNRNEQLPIVEEALNDLLKVEGNFILTLYDYKGLPDDVDGDNVVAIDGEYELYMHVLTKFCEDNRDRITCSKDIEDYVGIHGVTISLE